MVCHRSGQDSQHLFGDVLSTWGGPGAQLAALRWQLAASGADAAGCAVTETEGRPQYQNLNCTTTRTILGVRIAVGTPPMPPFRNGVTDVVSVCASEQTVLAVRPLKIWLSALMV